MWTKKNLESEPIEVMTNQTQFGVEKPLFEDPPKFVNPNLPKTTTPHKRSPLPFIIGGGVLLIFALMLSYTLLRRQQTVISQQIEVTPTPTSTQNQGVFETRLEELQTDFRAADPAQAQLPFPPVSLNIVLDPVRR